MKQEELHHRDKEQHDERAPIPDAVDQFFSGDSEDASKHSDVSSAPYECNLRPQRYR